MKKEGKPYFGGSLDQMHTSLQATFFERASASASSVDLGLDHQSVEVLGLLLQFVRDRDGIFSSEGRATNKNGYIVLFE